MSDAFDTADFYGLDPRAERYYAKTPWEAIHNNGVDDFADAEAITVYAFKRAEHIPTRTLADHALESLEKRMRDECTILDPEEEWSPSPRVRELAMQLAEMIREDHKPWHCNPAGERTLTFAEWRRIGDGDG